MSAQAPSTPTAVKTEDAGPASTASPEKPKERKRRLGVDPSLILSEGRSKRRRTPTPEPIVNKNDMDPKDPERAKALGLALYYKIMAMKDSDGDQLAQPFIKLPNKRQFPDYYETIKHPFSLEQVKDKLDAAKYDTLRDVCHDLGQIWNNAKRYNIKDSTLFQWAKKLHKVTRTFYSRETSQQEDTDSEDDDAPTTSRGITADAASPAPATAGPSTPADDGSGRTGKKRGSYMKDGPTVYKLIKPCMRAIKEAKSGDGTDREIATIFLALPDRREFPDYYKRIKHPVSLTEIEQRMIGRRYDNADQFFQEVELMANNALNYNEEHSEVWRDARQVLEIVQIHRGLVRERLAQPLQKGQPPSKPRQSLGAPGRLHGVPSPSPHTPHAQIPQLQQHPMLVTPEMRAAASFQQAQAYAAYGSPATPGGLTPQQLAQQALGMPQPSYLPQLPQGVVSEEVVASLGRYPQAEQQAWINSLPPLALAIYRQMVAVNEARKRGVAPPPVAPLLADSPVGGRPSSAVQEPDVPQDPTIKHIDVGFAAAPEPKGSRKAIRLQNYRGVFVHVLLVGANTTELELTAHVEKNADDEAKPVPEVALRINGQNAPPPTQLHTEGDNRPPALRWTVPVPLTRIEAKIELVASRQGIKIETSAILVNRQF
ncbi:hypothetical protein Q8F55_004052 [Vanrija albida]|uniref:Bromo domain-containing protein n=1 Tax=Vanrija albida TaxID=181172 RepID=A0ABR3Q5N6_9TREE